MKGNPLKYIQQLLDKADQLLTTEPARMIGYGAAIAIFLVLRVVGEVRPGLVPVMSFEETIGLAFTALATVTILVESIRRFVYSPLTYIEDLSDESQAAHEAAHLEEDLHRWKAAIEAEVAAQRAEAAQTRTVNIGTVTPEGSTGKVN